MHSSVIIAQHKDLKMHPHTNKKSNNNNNQKTEIVIISVQTHHPSSLACLFCCFAASLLKQTGEGKKNKIKEDPSGVHLNIRYFHSLYYSRLKHASTGGNAVESLRRMASTVPVKGQSSKTE